MNESDVMATILQTGLTEARRMGATRLTALNIVMDDDGIVSADQVRTQFETLARGTLAEDARIKIDFCASERHCWTCKTIFMGRGFDAACPLCGSPGLRITRAPTIYLDSIEVEYKLNRVPHLPQIYAGSSRPHRLHRRRVSER